MPPHLRARHDLVLIPFTSLRRTFPRSGVITQAYCTVALLVEMMADDRALRVRGLFARELATALLRFGTAGAQCPAGALSAAEGEWMDCHVWILQGETVLTMAHDGSRTGALQPPPEVGGSSGGP